MSRYSDAVLAAGPSAYWRLGEPLGSVAIDQKFARHGTYNTGVTLGVTGLIANDSDTAMTGTPTKGMIIPSGSAMATWSLQFWARSNGLNADFSGYFTQASDTFDIATFAPGDLRFYDGAGFDSIGVGSDVTPTFWVWQRSAATGLQVFKNGVSVYANAARGRALPAGEAYGLGVFGPAAPNSGTIDTFDEVALFPTLLSQAQVSSLYTLGTATTRTNRADLVSGITTMMSAFIAAHPTLLLRHFDARPKSVVTDWPCSYLDTLEMPELHWDSALRTTVFNPQIVFVFGETDPGETGDSIDALIDAMNDHLDTYPHIVAGTWWSDASWAEEAVPLSDSTSATGVRLTINGLSFANGRL